MTRAQATNHMRLDGLACGACEAGAGLARDVRLSAEAGSTRAERGLLRVPQAVAFVFAILVACACACLVSTPGAAWAASEPDGSWIAAVGDSTADYAKWYQDNPDADEFTISNAEELAYLSSLVRNKVLFAGKTIKLDADIDLAGHWWDPIGSDATYYFSGTFDGQGHTIKNMTIGSGSNFGSNTLRSSYAGLFGYITGGAVIENLKLDSGCSISFTDYGTDYPRHIGAIVGCAYSGANRISNCESNVSITVRHYYSSNPSLGNTQSYMLGGIAGFVGTTGSSVEGCTYGGAVVVLGAIDASGAAKPAASMIGEVGGIVGYISLATVSDCTNSGTFDFSDVVFSSQTRVAIVGGIFGYAVSSKVENCANSGEFKSWAITYTSVGAYNGRYNGIGGIGGYASTNSTINSCTNRSDIATCHGGAAGILLVATSTTVTNCANEGSVSVVEETFKSPSLTTVQACTRAGGIVGAFIGASTVSNCVNYGAVSVKAGAPTAGGIVGFVFSGASTITQCLNKGNVSISGVGKVGGAAGGIAGVSSVTYTISKCSNVAEVSSFCTGPTTASTTARFLLGGIASGTSSTLATGAAYSPTIQMCSNTGKIYSESPLTYAGGISGNAGNKVISDCYNTGDIEVKNGYAGGLVGTANARVTSRATATYEGALNYAGCFNAGKVSSGLYAGTIAGTVVAAATTASNTTGNVFNFDQTYYLKDCASVNGETSDAVIGTFSIADKIRQTYFYDDALGSFVNYIVGNVGANACTADELKTIASQIDPTCSIWVVNGLGASVNSGYPLFAWQVPSVLHIMNVDGTIEVLAVGVDENTSLTNDEIVALYNANAGSVLPTETGTLPAGYELSAAVSWVSEPNGQDKAEVKKGDAVADDNALIVEGIYDTSKQGSVKVYATDIYDDENGYATQLATYSITYYGVEGCTNTNPETYTVLDEIELVAPTAASADGKVFVGWIASAPFDYVVQVSGSTGSYKIPNMLLLPSQSIIGSIPAGSTGDKIFTAVWADADDAVVVKYRNAQGVETSIPVPSATVVSIDGVEVSADEATGQINLAKVFAPSEEVNPAAGYATVGYEAVVGETNVIAVDDTQTDQYTLDLVTTSGSPITVTLKANANGGELAYGFPASFTVADSIVLPNASYGVRTFDAWCFDDDLNVVAGTPNANGLYVLNAVAAFDRDPETREYRYLTQNTDGSYVLTLNARWKMYDVEYKLDKGVVNSDENPVEFELADRTITLASPVRAGYDFVGWYVRVPIVDDEGDKDEESGEDVEDAEGSGSVEDDVIVENDKKYKKVFVTEIDCSEPGDVTLYAEWEAIDYTVNLNLYVADNESFSASWTDDFGEENGFTWVGDDSETGVGHYSYTYNADDLEADFTLPAPEREGYEFYGWFTKDPNEDVVDLLGRVSTIYSGGVSHENLDLYTWWTVKNYAVSYELNGGEFSDEVSGEAPSTFNVNNAQVDQSIRLDGVVPTRDNYVFGGWYLDSAFVQPVSAIGGEGWSTWGDVTLYAKWTPVTFNISYELAGGTNAAGNPTTFTVESGALALSDPELMGYVFSGWYADESFTTPVTEIGGEGWSTWSDVTLYAKWSEPTGGSGQQAIITASSTGAITVSVDESFPFSDAEIVRIAREDGSFETTAVVADSTVSFYAPVVGDYVVSQFSYPTAKGGDDHDGMDVWYNISMLSQNHLSTLPSTANAVNVIPRILSTSATGGLSLSNGGLDSQNLFVPYRGVSTTDFSEVSYGSAEEPVAVLAHFVGWDNADDSAATGGVVENTLQMEKQTADGLIGYKSSQANALATATAAAAGSDTTGFATDFSSTYLVVEDRDENTGSLIASILFTPDADVSPAAYGQGGSQAFSLSVNPSESLLAERLAAHSDYAGNAAGATAAAAEIASAQAASDSMVVLANLDTMAAYNTGEKVYTVDVERLSGGTIAAGSQVVLSYITGSGDTSLYTPSALYEQKAQATDATYVVDEDGYLAFGLYGGGVYALSLAEDEADVEALAAVFAVADPGTDEPDDGDEPDDDDEPDDGNTGDNSNTGNTGSNTGNTGNTGNSGNSDNSGSTGSNGSTGSTGSINLGSTGSTGSTGSSGSGGTGISAIDTSGSGDSVAAIDVDGVSDELAEDAEEGDAISPTGILNARDADGIEKGIAESNSGHGAVWNFFHDADGSWIWWRILLLILLLLILLVLLALLIRWLLAKRKKDEQEDADQDNVSMPASATSAGTLGSNAARAGDASLTSDQATAAAIAAAAQAAAQAQQTRVIK